MPRYKSPFDEFRHFQLLAQRWAEKDKKLKDYACNLLAPKLVILDNVIEKLPEGHPVRTRLSEIREILKRIGEVQWILNADIVTNLALKVGKTIPETSADDVRQILEEMKESGASEDSESDF